MSLQIHEQSHAMNNPSRCLSERQVKGASGADEVTKEMYSERLEENVEDLVARMKRQAYIV